MSSLFRRDRKEVFLLLVVVVVVVVVVVYFHSSCMLSLSSFDKKFFKSHTFCELVSQNRKSTQRDTNLHCEGRRSNCLSLRRDCRDKTTTQHYALLQRTKITMNSGGEYLDTPLPFNSR